MYICIRLCERGPVPEGAAGLRVGRRDGPQALLYYIYTCIDIVIYIYVSLSLYIYIYIYLYINQ